FFTLSPSYILRKPTFILFPLRRLPFGRISASISSSSSTEFKISFAPSPKKVLIPDTSPHCPSVAPLPVIIPWIVRDENGNLKLQATPPVGFLQAISESKPSPTKEKKKEPVGFLQAISESKSSPTKEKKERALAPKHSKAARRFYNQNVKEPQRLSKVLAAAGVASRRGCERLIFEGKVTVNGSLCTSPQALVDLSKDSIYVNGNRLSKRLPPKLHFALNKPKGYICSNGEETKSVVSLFDDYWKSWNKTNPGIPRPRLFTVGRLDVATTGLIFVTNDGDFAQQISHPSSKFTKEYVASVDGVVHRRHLTALSDGTEVEGMHCAPDYVELLPAQPNVPRSRLRIV
ncbi:uncharacterized protein LOC110038979, partial [Phalaenopsis equestris]|uniref:uncharacterized protein LOC110038979 n=1 Tax=Phalaenopsis equestris TaxID=78828 RepID=UPI0009E20091